MLHQARALRGWRRERAGFVPYRVVTIPGRPFAHIWRLKPLVSHWILGPITRLGWQVRPVGTEWEVGPLVERWRLGPLVERWSAELPNASP
ncbi:MAG: hypothetical protein V4472_25135 [Pseudomonadota bacterium]